MGMYTELIFGASLKKETPTQVIDALKYINGEIEEKPKDFPLPEGRCEWMFRSGSYYFGISDGVTKLWQDDQTKRWLLCARFNIKNYEDEIDTFLNWIKPYIESGSGNREMYAIKMYEEQDEPTIYYLH
jgi:hypothetical protein